MEVGRRSFLATGALACVSRAVIPLAGLFGGDANAAIGKIPVRAIGVNCFDLFYTTIVGPTASRTPLVRLLEMQKLHIPFVRFAASPFWSSEWKLYFQDPALYFQRLDAVFRAAERLGIGLVPSLFWNPVAVSDNVGEPVSAWAEDGTKTRAFMNRYVDEVVARYAKSSALWMWEFGNEFNTYSDLPNALLFWPKSEGKAGSVVRTEADKVSRTMLIDICAAFGRRVRRIDPQHMICSGSDFPRENANSLARGKFRTDTVDEYKANLIKIAPEPINVVSVHLYPGRKVKQFGGVNRYMDLLAPTVAAAAEKGKRVFVGEFGVSSKTQKTSERREFSEMLNAVVDSGVHYAAVWVYDYAAQEGEWNISAKGGRTYQLEMIYSANRRLGI